MIFASPKKLDLAFLSKLIHEHQLNPRPVPNFSLFPGAWDETAEWKRSVERYSWGSIIFLSNVEADEHFTILAVGAFNLDAGLVKHNGVVEPLPVPWYKKLAAVFKGTMMNNGQPIQLPACLGGHQPDYVCDGGYNSQGQLERPCAWRDRCIALQNESARLDQPVSKMLAGKPPEEVVRFTSKLIAATPVPPAPSLPPAAPVLGRPIGKDESYKPKSTPPAPRLKRLLNKSTTAPKAEKVADKRGVTRDAAKEMFQTLVKDIEQRVKPRAIVDQKEAATDELFIRDRLDSSGYASLVLKRGGTRDLGVISVRLQEYGLSVQFSVEMDHPLLAPIKAHLVSYKDGQYLTKAKQIPRDISLETVAEITAALVDIKVKQ